MGLKRKATVVAEEDSEPELDAPLPPSLRTPITETVASEEEPEAPVSENELDDNAENITANSNLLSGACEDGDLATVQLLDTLFSTLDSIHHSTDKDAPSLGAGTHF